MAVKEKSLSLLKSAGHGEAPAEQALTLGKRAMSLRGHFASDVRALTEHMVESCDISHVSLLKQKSPQAGNGAFSAYLVH